MYSKPLKKIYVDLDDLIVCNAIFVFAVLNGLKCNCSEVNMKHVPMMVERHECRPATQRLNILAKHAITTEMFKLFSLFARNQFVVTL